MKRFHRLLSAAALAASLLTPVSSQAAFVAWICNDFSCTGGDGDIFVVDNAAGDGSAVNGAIVFSTSAFGYSFLLNASQSKPLIGSASQPQLDLTFSATTQGAAGPVYLWAIDDGFTGSGGPYSLTLGGTNSGGSGTATASVYANTSSFLVDSVVGTGAAFAAASSGSFVAPSNPYLLALLIQVSRSTAGTTTGDGNFSVPEPGTLALAGLAMFGIAATRIRRRSPR